MDRRSHKFDVLIFNGLGLSLTCKQPYEELDPAIRALVDMMNTVQPLRTIASCQGHWYGKPPYVYFRAPVYIAAMIERRLREDAMSSHPKLHGNWCVRGLFDGDYEQTFLLHAPNYHRGAESLIWAAWLFGVHRRRLNAELLALTHFVQQAILADLGVNAKPEIAGSGNEH